MHADHSCEIDLVRYALEFGQGSVPLRVYAPEPDSLRRPVFDPIESHDDMSVQIGTLTLQFMEVRHAVPTVAVRITDKNGHVLFYTGDTAYFDGLVEAAKDADLLLADACLADESNPKALRNHMTGEQVVQLGRQANCKRILLTHRFGANPTYPLPKDADNASFAEEGDVFEI